MVPLAGLVPIATVMLVVAVVSHPTAMAGLGTRPRVEAQRASTARQRGVASWGRRERNRHGDEPLSGRAVAQLADVVAAPAVRRVARGHAAAVIATHAHGGERQAPGDQCGDEPSSGRIVAKLAVPVVAPAVRHTARGHAAGMTDRRSVSGAD